MSRHEVKSFNTDQFTVIVGWDNPLQTYFAQVWDAQLKDEDDKGCVFWVGTHLGSVRSVAALAEVISGYALLPEDTMEQLEQDQAETELPTPLQQWVSARLGPESICDGQVSEVVDDLHDHRCVICGFTTTSRCGCDTPREPTYCDPCDEIPF